MEHIVDPAHGSPSKNKEVCGIRCSLVDDLLMAGNSEFLALVVESLRTDFQVGSEDENDITFVWQRIRWMQDNTGNSYIRVDQELCVDEIDEMIFDKG